MNIKVAPRAYRRFSKTITFDGNAGTGAIGNVPIFTVTGQVLLHIMAPLATVTLAGATATLALGVTGNTALLIGATTATTITSGLLWTSTTPATGGAAAPAALTNVIVAANVVGTVATAAITAGAIRFDGLWLPLSADGNIV